MIVRKHTHTLALLFAWRGTIFPKVLPAMLILSTISLLFGLIAHYHWFQIPTPPLLGFTIFGVVLSIFLGFRNNACYDRWWEGRKHWGALIALQRNMIRDTLVLPQENREFILRQVIVFTTLLRDRLRYQTAHHETFLNYGQMNEEHIEAFSNHINPLQVALENMQNSLLEVLKTQQLNPVIYTKLSSHIDALCNIQTACDRIANTPLPFSYSVLLHRAIHSFCFMLPFGLEASLGLWTPIMVAWLVYMFLGLDALSTQLEEPFGTQENDLPLDSFVRLVEREILIAIGEPIPAMLQPRKGNLL